MQSLVAIPFYVDEDMSLRREHQDLIRVEVERQVNQAVDAFRPHGWRRVTHWAREWGITGAIITSFIALVAITLGALYQSFSHVKEETEFRTHANDTLKEIQESLKDIRSSVDTTKLKQIGANPAAPESISEAKNVLTTAAASRTRIDPNIVKSV